MVPCEVGGAGSVELTVASAMVFMVRLSIGTESLVIVLLSGSTGSTVTEEIWPNCSVKFNKLFSAVSFPSFDAARFFLQQSMQCVCGFLFQPRDDRE